MNLTLLIILIIALTTHTVMSALAIMQVRRFYSINPSLKRFTWVYIISSVVILIATLILFLSLGQV
ncbi:MAG: hypothetical protein WC882_04025 [Candidatus Gracilibacteria bacterium]